MFEGRQFLIGGFLEGGCVIIVVFRSFALQLGVKFSEAFGAVANEVSLEFVFDVLCHLGRPGVEVSIVGADIGEEAGPEFSAQGVASIRHPVIHFVVDI